MALSLPAGEVEIAVTEGAAPLEFESDLVVVAAVDKGGVLDEVVVGAKRLMMSSIRLWMLSASWEKSGPSVDSDEY